MSAAFSLSIRTRISGLPLTKLSLRSTSPEIRSIFFRIASWPAYGRLARLDTEQARVGERVESDEDGKDDVRDFAAKQGVSEQEALQKGMEVKSVEFVKLGAEVYHKA